MRVRLRAHQTFPRGKGFPADERYSRHRSARSSSSRKGSLPRLGRRTGEANYVAGLDLRGRAGRNCVHLQSSKAVTGMLLDNLVRVAFDCSSHLEHLHELAVRYGDRKPDLADLCLVRMSELYPRHPVVTIDRDFRVYRRYRREIIPTLCPPN